MDGNKRDSHGTSTANEYKAGCRLDRRRGVSSGAGRALCGSVVVDGGEGESGEILTLGRGDASGTGGPGYLTLESCITLMSLAGAKAVPRVAALWHPRFGRITFAVHCSSPF